MGKNTKRAEPEGTTEFDLVAPPMPTVPTLKCIVCGDTGVVQRSEFPLAKPAPGHIDAMGRCPFCGGGEPPTMQ
jgi:hypothetical protein